MHVVHIKNFNSLVAYLSRHEYDFDVIAISETWLQNNEMAFIQGYNLSSLPRNSFNHGGGVSALRKREH